MQRAAAEVIEGFCQAESPSDVWQLLADHAGSIGVDWVQYIYFERTQPARIGGASTTPKGWVDRYRKNGYGGADPAARRCAVSLEPLWVEPLRDLRKPGLPELGKRAIAESYDLGMRRGLVLPSWTMGGDVVAGITLKAGRYEADFLDPAAGLVASLHLIASAAHHRYQQLLRRQCQLPISLTPRERDVLCYAAMGLRSSRIAERLGIAVVTVDLHFSSAARKLGARSRAQAVAEAILNGAILP